MKIEGSSIDVKHLFSVGNEVIGLHLLKIKNAGYPASINIRINLVIIYLNFDLNLKQVSGTIGVID